MGRATVIAVAERLGNAIAAPVLPYSVNNGNANLPGTIGLTAEAFALVNEQVIEQIIKNGFKNVDAKHSPQGVHVYFCDEVYAKANADFDSYLKAHNLPISAHAGIPDTSEMMYLGLDKGWVRKEELANAVGNPPRKRGDPPPDPGTERPNNGIQGDARPSTRS